MFHNLVRDHVPCMLNIHFMYRLRQKDLAPLLGIPFTSHHLRQCEHTHFIMHCMVGCNCILLLRFCKFFLEPVQVIEL